LTVAARCTVVAVRFDAEPMSTCVVEGGALEMIRPNPSSGIPVVETLSGSRW